jgi:vacuolar-type H+-ATPase subunit I/STV1
MWVEFSSKFYSGMGYEFVPLSFQRVLKEKLEAE